MNDRAPVADWATDFDHLDPRWVEDPPSIWRELRQTRPVAHTGRFEGVYLPSRYEDIRAVAYDTEHFSISPYCSPRGQRAAAAIPADHLRSARASR